MRLIKVRYRNFCQYRDREFEFSPGLNAIVGPIGSGKSNALTGLLGALTGDFSRTPGVKDANICQLAKRGEPSFVELEAEHNNTIFTIKRGLKPSKQELTIGGDIYTKDKDIRDKLEQILGISNDLLSKYIFVPQWGIFDFLSATDTERAKAFQQLFGTAIAEKIYKELGDFSCEVPPAPVDGDAVRIRLAERETELKNVLLDLNKYIVLPDPWVEVNDLNYKLVADYRKRETLTAKLVQLDAEEKKLEVEYIPAKDALEKLNEDVEAVAGLVAANKPQVEAARKTLALWPAYRLAQSLAARARQTLAQLDASVAEVAAPVKPENYLHADNKAEPALVAYEENLTRWRQLNQTVQTFKLGAELVECPTCQTPVANLAPRLEEFRLEADKRQVFIAATYKRIVDSKAYDKALSEFQSRQRSYDAARKECIRQQQEAEVTQKPAEDEATLRAVVNEQQTYEQGLVNLQKEAFQQSSLVSRMVGQGQQLAGQLLAVAQELEKLPEISKETAVAAEAALVNTRASVEARSQLRMQRTILDRAVADESKALHDFEVWKSNSYKIAACRDHLQGVREIFHHSNLPEKVAQSYLRAMREAINDNLEAFELPFRIEVLPGLKFEATFPDGIKQPANRLSGGQKVLFALGFRIVVNSIFARDLGLLCLDEPTAGLDEDSLTCLDTAMSRLRKLAQTSGLQVLLVTHDRGRDSLYDRVFDLAKA